MDQQILDEIKRLRQDLEVGAAINLIEGINTVETLALLGHFIAKRRAPTARELDGPGARRPRALGGAGAPHAGARARRGDRARRAHGGSRGR